jgi:hypothetical protein
MALSGGLVSALCGSLTTMARRRVFQVYKDHYNEEQAKGKKTQLKTIFMTRRRTCGGVYFPSHSCLMSFRFFCFLVDLLLCFVVTPFFEKSQHFSWPVAWKILDD